MRKLITAVLILASFEAYAMTYFLVAQYYRNGRNMCEYSNGTVLVANLCPLTIEG